MKASLQVCRLSPSQPAVRLEQSGGLYLLSLVEKLWLAASTNALIKKPYGACIQ